MVSACASAPKSHPKVDLDWEFVEVIPGETRACLKKEDVQKIREMQLRCEAPK